MEPRSPLVAWLLAVGLTAVAGCAQPGPAPFSIRISAPEGPVAVGSQPRIGVVLTNTSKGIISLYFSKASDALLDGCQVHMYDDGGKHLKMSKYSWWLFGKKSAADDENDYSDYKDVAFSLMRGGGWGPLRPGDTLESHFDLSEAYDLDRPGKYQIYVTRESPGEDQGGKVTVRSNTITITVTDSIKPSVAIRISTPRTEVSVGSPVVVVLRETNVSAHKICFDAPNEGRRYIGITLRKSDGIPVWETQRGRMVHPGIDPQAPAGLGKCLDPGESFDEVSDLREDFYLDKPGKYTVQAQQLDKESQIIVKSNPITLTVGN